MSFQLFYNRYRPLFDLHAAGVRKVWVCDDVFLALAQEVWNPHQYADRIGRDFAVDLGGLSVLPRSCRRLVQPRPVFATTDPY